MRNVKQVVKGNILTLIVDLSAKGSLSASGKSDSIATSGGNQPLDAQPDILLGLNVFRRANSPEAKARQAEVTAEKSARETAKRTEELSAIVAAAQLMQPAQ